MDIQPNSLKRPLPWEKHYPSYLTWDQEISIGTVPSLLEQAAAKYGDRPAIEYRDREISFNELARLVDRMAAGMMRFGIGGGSKVALFLPNTPWHSVCFFACLKAGATVVHLSPLDAPRELVHKVMDSGAEVVVTTCLAGMGNGAAKFVEMGFAKHLFIGEDQYWGGPAPAEPLPYAENITNIADLLTDELPASWPELNVNDVALLQYTGGTTGLAKAAMISHANITAATSIFASGRDAARTPPGGERVIAVLPMFHIYALGVILLLNIAEGNLTLLRPRFDLATTIRDIEEKRATIFPAVPTMLIALLNVPGIETHDFSSLTTVGSGGAPMPHEVTMTVEGLIKQRLAGGWGMTETVAVGTSIPETVTSRPGLIGAPLPHVELKIVDINDATKDLGVGERGELAIRGPNVFGGYHNQEELNKTQFVNGFFLTGDVGHMDEDGLFYIVDRKKRMIISGGFNVYPNMIENAIFEHPDVEEVIVIGVPDQYRGESAKAFVKLITGRPEFDIDELRSFLIDKVGKHELPTAVEFRAELPKSPVGKLLANVLVEEERARAAG